MLLTCYSQGNDKIFFYELSWQLILPSLRINFKSKSFFYLKGIDLDGSTGMREWERENFLIDIDLNSLKWKIFIKSMSMFLSFIVGKHFVIRKDCAAFSFYFNDELFQQLIGMLMNVSFTRRFNFALKDVCWFVFTPIIVIRIDANVVLKVDALQVVVASEVSKYLR